MDINYKNGLLLCCCWLDAAIGVGSNTSPPALEGKPNLSLRISLIDFGLGLSCMKGFVFDDGAIVDTTNGLASGGLSDAGFARMLSTSTRCAPFNMNGDFLNRIRLCGCDTWLLHKQVGRRL